MAGALLSILDIATDIFVIMGYMGKRETVQYDHFLLGMAVTSVVFLLLLCILQNGVTLDREHVNGAGRELRERVGVRGTDAGASWLHGGVLGGHVRSVLLAHEEVVQENILQFREREGGDYVEVRSENERVKATVAS